MKPSSLESRPPERPAHADGDTVSSISPDTGDARSTDELAGMLRPDPQGGLGWLNSYRLLQVLGRGGMGIVFLADDTANKRQVALKVMRPFLAQKAVARERFLREARATSQVEHDHIVRTYHVGEYRGVPYMAMQFLRGGSLETWLSQGNRPTLRQAVRIAREAALGLAAAHAHGLIHRDVKPSNLWLENRAADPDDAGRALMPVRVKLLDFGLARIAHEASTLTRLGSIVGTPAYMSPEQARGRDVDFRSDLFSLGCVLYRLCTGVLPFRGDDTSALLSALISAEPPSAQRLNPAMPPALAELIERLLAKDPADRPANAQTVADALRTLEADLSRRPSAPPAPAPAPSWQRWFSSARARWLVGIGLAVVLALTVTLVTLTPSSGTVVVRAADDPARTALQKATLRIVEQRTGLTHIMALGVQSLPPGRYAVEAGSVPPGMNFEPATFDVSARGPVAVVVRTAPRSANP